MSYDTISSGTTDQFLSIYEGNISHLYNDGKNIPTIGIGLNLQNPSEMAGVNEATIADVLWHSKASVTQHYARAQLLELRTALERITEESKASNKLLLTLAAERDPKGPKKKLSPFKVPSASA